MLREDRLASLPRQRQRQRQRQPSNPLSLLRRHPQRLQHHLRGNTVGVFHFAVFHEQVHGAQGGGDDHAHGHFFVGVVEVALPAAGLQVGAEVGGEGGAHAFGVADHGDEGAGPVGVGAGFVHEGAHGDAEPFGAAVDGFADGEDLFGELDGEFQADGFEHLFAGAEVVVDGAVGDAGFFGQGVEREVTDAGAGVDAQGGVQQLSPGAGFLFVAPGQGTGRGFAGAGRRFFCHETVPTVGLGGVMILGKAQY